MTNKGRLALSKELTDLLKDIERWMDETHAILALRESHEKAKAVVLQGELLLRHYHHWLVRHLAIWDNARDTGVEWCELSMKRPGDLCLLNLNNALAGRLDYFARHYLPVIQTMIYGEKAPKPPWRQTACPKATTHPVRLKNAAS